MKFLPSILVLFLSISITSCSDKATEPPFILSNANIAGIYSINSLNTETKETATSSSGATVNLSTTEAVGDTFQVNFLINVNETYTASGQYRVVARITENNGTQSEETEIINFETSGSYQINTTNSTITFSPINEQFVEGEFEIITFNETVISMTQEVEDVQGSNANITTSTIGLKRQ